MQRIRTLASHELTGSTIRYGIAGALVAAVYLGLPLALSAGGVALQVAIPIGYVVAMTVHFNLQRQFVFRHVAAFALSARQQVGRYLVIGAVQYPTTAICVAELPALLHVSERIVYVATTITISTICFLLLRTRVFHAQDALGIEPPGPLATGRSGRPAAE